MYSGYISYIISWEVNLNCHDVPFALKPTRHVIFFSGAILQIFQLMEMHRVGIQPPVRRRWNGRGEREWEPVVIESVLCLSSRIDFLSDLFDRWNLKVSGLLSDAVGFMVSQAGTVKQQEIKEIGSRCWRAPHIKTVVALWRSLNWSLNVPGWLVCFVFLERKGWPRIKNPSFLKAVDDGNDGEPLVQSRMRLSEMMLWTSDDAIRIFTGKHMRFWTLIWKTFAIFASVLRSELLCSWFW